MSDKKVKLKDMPEIIKNMIYRQLEARKLKLRFVELNISRNGEVEYQFFSLYDLDAAPGITFYLSSFCERKMHYQHLFKISFNKNIFPARICEEDVPFHYISYSPQIHNFIELENEISRIISREDIKKFIEQEEYLSGMDLWRDAVYSGCFDKNKKGE